MNRSSGSRQSTSTGSRFPKLRTCRQQFWSDDKASSARPRVPQPPIQLYGRTHIGEGIVGVMRMQRDSDVFAQRSKFEVRRWSQLRMFLKEPQGSVERAVDSIVGRKVQLLPFEPLPQKWPIEGSVVGDQTSLPEATSISRVFTGDRVPNQELAKPQRDFSRRTSLSIPPPSVVVSSRQGSLRGLPLTELQLGLKHFQRSTSAINGDRSNLHDGPPWLLAGSLKVDKYKSPRKRFPRSAWVAASTEFVALFSIRHSRRHTTVFASMASSSKFIRLAPLPVLPASRDISNPTTGC